MGLIQIIPKINSVMPKIVWVMELAQRNTWNVISSCRKILWREYVLRSYSFVLIENKCYVSIPMLLPSRTRFLIFELIYKFNTTFTKTMICMRKPLQHITYETFSKSWYSPGTTNTYSRLQFLLHTHSLYDDSLWM